jgi:UDP-2,3-diacylglucosamine hydrolase
MSCILLVGDAHLRDGEAEVEAFLGFLESLPAGTVALYLLGDLFDLWVGSPAFISTAHRRVIVALRRLRAGGVRLVYVEGNRDYHLRRAYLGDPFDELAESHVEVPFGPRRLHLAHGDQVNRRDRPYRLWRRLAKGPLLLGVFGLLPPGLAGSLASGIERRMARTNLRHRIRFPEEDCRLYALACRKQGCDTVVLGHFHQPMRRSFGEGAGRVELFVLPAWREERAYLKFDSGGGAVFETFPLGGDGIRVGRDVLSRGGEGA